MGGLERLSVKRLLLCQVTALVQKSRNPMNTCNPSVWARDGRNPGAGQSPSLFAGAAPKKELPSIANISWPRTGKTRGPHFRTPGTRDVTKQICKVN